MGPRVAVSDELLGSRIEVLLCATHALLESSRGRLIQDPDAGAMSFGDVDAEEAWAFGSVAR